MIILGFDPGSHHTGWCSIDVRGGASGLPLTATYQESGEVESKPSAIAQVLRSVAPAIVALESLEGIAYPAKGAGIVSGLVASSKIAGEILALAWREDINVTELPAVKWRRLVLGQPSATDRQIADTIPRLIHGWPKRSNVHVRDAGGVALGVAWLRNGKPPPRLDEGLGITQ